MNKEFIPYEQALELKELGFEKICFAWYHKGKLTFNELYNLPDINQNTRNTSAPLYQQAFKWFREKYGIYTIIEFSAAFNLWIFTINKIKGGFNVGGSNYNTYEEAEIACLKKLIEIIKNK